MLQTQVLDNTGFILNPTLNFQWKQFVAGIYHHKLNNRFSTRVDATIYTLIATILGQLADESRFPTASGTIQKNGQPLLHS